MCKLLIIPNVKNKELTQKFMKAARPDFTKHDDDGVGYAALTNKGLYGERWLNVKDAFRRRVNCPIKGHEAFAQMGAALEAYSPEGTYNTFGVDGDKWHSVIYHSRAATCDINLKNVHPFVDGDTALVHNGIISDAPTEWTPVQSTCDSEQALNGYNALSLSEDINKVRVLADELQGWYALGVLTKQASGQWILDIIKDAKTPLSATYIKELDSIVFCTDPSIVEGACKLLKWTVGDTFEMKGDKVIRFDAITGQVIDMADFESFNVTYTRASTTGTSFGEKDRPLLQAAKEWSGYNYDKDARDYSEEDYEAMEEAINENEELDFEMRERMAYESFGNEKNQGELVRIVSKRFSR